MIFSADDINELTETEEDKLQKVVNAKLLSATEKIVQGISQLAKENKDNGDKLNKRMGALIEKMDAAFSKPEKQIDFSPVIEAIKTLAESHSQKTGEMEVMKGLVQLFATELQKNRTELSTIISKIQPKDYENNFAELTSKMDEKKSDEWKFDFIRNPQGVLQTIKAKAIGNR